MKRISALFVLIFASLSAVSHAVEWGDIATISDTTAGHLCGYDLNGDGAHIECPATAPFVDSAGNVTITGVISASAFYGDGSNLTGVSGVSALASLTDVSVSSPSVGEFLSWNGSTWQPAFASGVTVYTLISQATGTAIGNLTLGGGLASAFDGNNTQNQSQGAQSPSQQGWIGKDFGSGNEKSIRKWSAWGSSDYGFHNPTNGAFTHTLQYKDSACTTDSGWTSVGSYSMTDVAGATYTQTVEDVGAHQCWRIDQTSGTGNGRVAELVFYAGVDSASGGDNLGSHTASQTLDMNTYGIDNVGSITATGTLAVSGTARVGGTGAEACTASDYGKIRLNPATNKMQLCFPTN